MAFGANLTRREQYLIAVGFAAVLLGGAYWYFLHAPKSEKLDGLEKRIVSLETANQQARRDAAQGNMERLRADLERDARALEVVQTLVPTRNEVPALLEDISTAARRVGLDIASVEPRAVIGGDDFETHRYKIAVIGDYHAIAQLLTNVGSLRRIVAPVTLEMKAHAGTLRRRRVTNLRATAERPDLQATFEIQTYVSREVPGSELLAGLQNAQRDEPPAAEFASDTQAPESGT